MKLRKHGADQGKSLGKGEKEPVAGGIVVDESLMLTMFRIPRPMSLHKRNTGSHPRLSWAGLGSAVVDNCCGKDEI